MGSSVVKTARRGELSGGFLGAQLAGGDPVSAYFAYTGTIVATVVVASAILAMLEAVNEERHGAGEYLRATGTSPARVLTGHLGVALICELASYLAAFLHGIWHHSRTSVRAPRRI